MKSNRYSEIRKQGIKENHYLKEYYIKIFAKWKIFKKEYTLRLKKTTTYLEGLMKTKQKENLMEFEDYEVSEDYQVQVILLNILGKRLQEKDCFQQNYIIEHFF